MAFADWWKETFETPTMVNPETYKDPYKEARDKLAAKGTPVSNVTKSTGQNSLLSVTEANKAIDSPKPEEEGRKLIDRNLTNDGGNEMKAGENTVLQQEAQKAATDPVPKFADTLNFYNTWAEENLPSFSASEMEQVDSAVTETQQEITDAAGDEESFKAVADKMGAEPSIAQQAWDTTKGVLDRVDWLTMLVVTAAAASTGSNATKAIANGLIRGMESRAGQKQLEAKQKADQAAAAEKTRQWEAEQAVRVANAQTNRLNAEETKRKNTLLDERERNKGAGSLLGKFSPIQIDAEVSQVLDGFGLKGSLLPWKMSDSQRTGLQSEVNQYVTERLASGDTRGIQAIAVEKLQDMKKKQAEAKKKE